MGASFEDLAATSLTVKTDFQSDKRFALQSFLNIRIPALNADDVSNFGFTACMHANRPCEPYFV